MSLSNYSSVVNDILFSNAKGIKLLENGRFKKATTAFSSSLTALRRVLVGDSSDGYILPLPELILRFGAQSILASRGDSPGYDAEERPFIFRTPMEVTLSHGKDAGSTRVSQTRLMRLSFALMFNLALALHCSGAIKASGNISVHRLNKALGLYKLARSVAENAKCLGNMETLAIATNLGHIHETLGDLDRASLCYNQVISIIFDHQLSSGCGGAQKEIIQFERIFSNAMRPILQRTKAAAAA